jgi:hypothetical protein
VETFLRALADAIKARDGKPMVARLADAYAIDGLEGRAKPADLFVQAVERMPGPTRDRRRVRSSGKERPSPRARNSVLARRRRRAPSASTLRPPPLVGLLLPEVERHGS